MCGRSVDTIVRHKKRIINIYEDKRLSPTRLHARCNDYGLEFAREFCLYTKINCRICSYVFLFVSVSGITRVVVHFIRENHVRSTMCLKTRFRLSVIVRPQVIFVRFSSLVSRRINAGSRFIRTFRFDLVQVHIHCYACSREYSDYYDKRNPFNDMYFHTANTVLVVWNAART